MERRPLPEVPGRRRCRTGAEQSSGPGRSAQGKGGKPRRIELVLGKDYTPWAISGNGKFDLPLAFAGYGISAPKANYDDFAGIDVAGKAVVMLRHLPRDEVDDKESAAIKATAYSAFHHKASNAYEHDAAAAIFCSDQAEVRRRRSQDDTLFSFHVAGEHLHPPRPAGNQLPPGRGRRHSPGSEANRLSAQSKTRSTARSSRLAAT